MPCGACREFLYQLDKENENMEIMVDYGSRKTITLRETSREHPRDKKGEKCIWKTKTISFFMKMKFL